MENDVFDAILKFLVPFTHVLLIYLHPKQAYKWSHVSSSTLNSHENSYLSSEQRLLS
jgi:hypothetical protein